MTMSTTRRNDEHSTEECCSEFGPETLKRLKRNDPTLSALDLQGEEIGNDGAVALAGALRKNTHLKYLSLADCSIDDDGGTALAKMLEYNTGLKELIVSYNWITDDGATVFAEALKINTTLEVLMLHETEISDKGAEAFLKALNYNSTITELLCNTTFSFFMTGIDVSPSLRSKIDDIVEANKAGLRTEKVLKNKARLTMRRKKRTYDKLSK
jgi:hypothetical protein